MKLAKENGIDGQGLEDLVRNEKLNGIVLREMQQAGKDGGLAGIEIIDGLVMADEEWTAANVSPFFFVDISSLAYTSFRALRRQLKRSTEEPSWPSTKKKSTRPTPKEIDKTGILFWQSIDVRCNEGNNL